jgi:hypothetical protein
VGDAIILCFSSFWLKISLDSIGLHDHSEGVST